MQVQVEAAPGCTMPVGCYVGVRVGEVLKQGRYNPTQHYKFPRLERRRNAKIDIYRHVGSCCVAVDPEMKTNSEVKMSTMDPDLSELMLKVSTKPESGKPEPVSKEQRDDRAKEVKKQAVDYMAKHGIEERLSDAMKLVLKQQPSDPIEFICRHLMGPRFEAMKVSSTPRKEAPVQQTPVRAAVPPIAKSANGTLPFDQKPSVGTWHSPGRGKSSAREQKRLASQRQAEAEAQYAVPGFALKPSVGTWLLPVKDPDRTPPKPKFVKGSWNVDGLREPTVMDITERCEVERVLTSSLLELTGEFADGAYHPLPASKSASMFGFGGMTISEEMALKTAGLLFGDTDADGRGIFVTPSRDVAAWVNCGEAGCHVQFIVQQPGSADGHREAYARLRSLESAMCETLRAGGQYALRQAVVRKSLNFGGGIRAPAEASCHELLEVERAVTVALSELTGELEGEYCPMAGAEGNPYGTSASPVEAECLLLAACDDPRAALFALNSEGGRGVFANYSHDVTVLVNQGGQHLQLVAQHRPKDASDAAAVRLERLEDTLRSALRQDGYELSSQ